MLNRNSIIGHFKQVDEELISLSSVAQIHGIGKSWIYELYQRYKEGKELFPKRGHREKRLTDRIAIAIRDKFLELRIKQNDIWFCPSMEILKNIMEYNDLELPEFSLETYRCCVKDMEEYPRNQKKAKRYRKRFEADAVGQLIQGDVTEYAWIEGAESFKLLMFIDDHSRYVLYADFIEHDDMQAHIRAWKIMLSNYGKPSAVYYDNDSKYRKRVMEKILNPVLVSGLKELDIQVINSTPYMPQGKGKIERKFQTFQKQLIFWFKEKKVKTWDQAREVLKWFVERHNDTESRAIKTTPNDRFKNSPDVFEVLYPKDLEKVEDALSHRMTRKVDDVNEISLDGIKYLIPTLDGMPLAGKVLELRVNPGLWFKAFYRDKFVVKCDIINKKEDDHDKNVA